MGDHRDPTRGNLREVVPHTYPTRTPPEPHSRTGDLAAAAPSDGDSDDGSGDGSDDGPE